MYLGNAETTQRVGQQLVTPGFAAVSSAFTPQIATLLSVSVPVVGVAIAGITMALTLLFSRKGPRQREVATEEVNQVIKLMQDNLAAYMAGPRTKESQLVALANFDQAWAWLESDQGCGNPELGAPGRVCLAERRRGASAPWCPTGTGCDPFTTLRDPIANDPQPEAVSMVAASSLPGLSTAGNSSFNVLALAGLALIAWGMSK
jgi:hypothetical protein